MAGFLSRLFGKGATRQDRARTLNYDELGPDHMPEGALAALWEVLDARYPVTNRMVRDSIDLRAGRKRPDMHPNWDDVDRESFRADGPEKYEEPRKTARRLGQKAARVKRPAAGIDPTAQKDSTKVERWSNGYLDEVYPDMAVTDLLLNESQTLVVQIPATCHWENIPTLYDEWEQEGPHVDQAAYDALPAAKQREYEQASAGGTYKRMRARYRLNADGERDDGSETFTTDLKTSAAHFRSEMEDAYARNLPIVLRGPISRLDFIPIDPVFSGKSTTVQGVLIRTLYRKAALKRDYRWEGSDSTQLLEPVSPHDGNSDGELYLYELWAYDEMHRPYVAYQVGTRTTNWSDDGTTAVVKLWEAYPGVTELPIAFEYGQHNAGSNADLRGLCFTTSRQQNWLQRDGVMTALAISTAESGYPTWGQKLTKDGIEAMRSLGGDVPLEFVMQPNTVVPLIGDVIELTAKGTNNDVKVLLEALNALGEKGSDPPGVFGGEGPTSGIDRAVQGKDMEIAHGDVIEGGRRIKERVGRHALMLASAIGRKSGRPVELYVMTETQAADGTTSTTRNRVALPPDLCGDNWDVIAEFPHQPGENLAATSLYVTLYEQGVILLREFRELWGDPNPEQFMAEKALEDYFLKSPAGQMDILTGMADYLKDSRLKKMLDLSNQGKVTTPGPGGFSTAAMGDVLGGAAGGGGAPPPPGQPALGVGMPPNPGMQSLGGNNAAAINASAAAAGSPLSAAGPVGMRPG